MSEKITVEIPIKLAEFIDKLSKDGYFKSREDFARCSVEIIAQLYGLAKTSEGGKSLLDVLSDNGKLGSKPALEKKSVTISKAPPQEIPAKTSHQSSEELSTIEMDILDLFVGAKFEFEDALHARYTMELMKLAKAPITREDFIKNLDELAKKGKIEKSEHRNKIVWKLLEGY